MDIIPCLVSFLFSRIFDSNHFQCVKFNFLIRFFFLIFTAQLIIASFLIEIQEYPRQFFFRYWLRQSLFTKIVNRPIVWYFFIIFTVILFCD